MRGEGRWKYQRVKMILFDSNPQLTRMENTQHSQVVIDAKLWR